jgi:hypothetical protein
MLVHDVDQLHVLVRCVIRSCRYSLKARLTGVQTINHHIDLLVESPVSISGVSSFSLTLPPSLVTP